ncbi:MAG TPA: hypothetical protein ENN31_00965 [Candidatus Vogelbacteria bacterium]|nr:hypothetical protein [Candidatus Vogelbacteria bacterium]
MKINFLHSLFRADNNFNPQPFKAWLKIFIFSSILLVVGCVFHFYLYFYISSDYLAKESVQEADILVLFDELTDLGL